jgi:HSP20 family protein
MFPFDKDKPLRKPSLFGGFDSFFADMDEEMAKMMQMANQPGSQGYVYGYRAYTGADGKPIIEEYSNVPGFKNSAGLEPAALPAEGGGGLETPSAEFEVIEPYHDVLIDGDKIKIIVEMPGVEKNDIKVQSQGHFVTVKAQGEDRKYAADIKTPDYVESKPQKANYKNGVLEITYKKADKTTDIDVE